MLGLLFVQRRELQRILLGTVEESAANERTSGGSASEVLLPLVIKNGVGFI